MEFEGEWATQKLISIKELTTAEIIFNIYSFAYTSIGDGVTFQTILKTGLFRPCSSGPLEPRRLGRLRPLHFLLGTLILINHAHILITRQLIIL